MTRSIVQLDIRVIKELGATIARSQLFGCGNDKQGELLAWSCKSGCAIYEDWRSNQVIHERMTVINNQFNRPTLPDRLK